MLGNNTEKKMIGVSLSHGAAVGKLKLLENQILETPIYGISGEIEEEVARYHQALADCREDMEETRARLISPQEKSPADNSFFTDDLEVKDIFGAYCQILEDPLLLQDVTNEIRISRLNAEYALEKVFKEYISKTKGMESQFFSERLCELMELQHRIQLFLQERKTKNKEVPEVSNFNTIIFCSEITPALVAQLDRNIIGIIVEHCGITSHAAIVARARGISMIGGISSDSLKELIGAEVALDADKGEIFISPTLAQKKEFVNRMQTSSLNPQPPHDAVFRSIYHCKDLENNNVEKACTHHLKLMANLALAEEMDLINRSICAGIGLLRTESLFWNLQIFPSEVEQAYIYTKIVKAAAGMPVIFRLFDLGGDKFTSFYPAQIDVKNPSLSCRSIRYLLQHPDKLLSQLKAILIASQYGPIKILIPMVACIEEIVMVRKYLAQAQIALENSISITAQSSIEVGVMIELPSAVIIADLLAQECDFFSVGTNDLLQYTLGVDRNSREKNTWYSATHPSMIRLLQQIARCAKDANIPVCICGEIASNPLFYPLFLDLNCDTLSVVPSALEKIRSLVPFPPESYAGLANTLASLKTAEEVKACLQECYDVWQCQREEKYDEYYSG